MTISLYQATAERFIHTVGAMRGVLGKTLDHCRSEGRTADSLLNARLAPDMLPLTFQIRSVCHHSLGALQGAQAGVFSPPSLDQIESFEALPAMLDEALAGLNAITPEAVDALQGREVVFQAGQMRLPFAAETFLLSFSLPNFYFHAATAYGLLRMNGAPLGKRDFLGRLLTKG